jgi:hypothetical protein
MGKGATECVVPKGNMYRTKLDRIDMQTSLGRIAHKAKVFFC